MFFRYFEMSVFFCRDPQTTTTLARWTSWVGCLWTAGRCPARSVSASLSWPSWASDRATSVVNCACPTAASARSWPASTRPAPSCPAQLVAANPVSPRLKSSSTSGTWSTGIRAFSPGRFGTGWSVTASATSIPCPRSAVSAGYCAIRLADYPRPCCRSIRPICTPVIIIITTIPLRPRAIILDQVRYVVTIARIFYFHNIHKKNHMDLSWLIKNRRRMANIIIIIAQKYGHLLCNNLHEAQHPT